MAIAETIGIWKRFDKTDVIVPARGLDKVFDAIVNSSDYGTGDKEQKLWPVPFDLLGGGCG